MADTASLGDRTKQYEAQKQHFLDGTLPAVIRLDGLQVLANWLITSCPDTVLIISRFTKAAFPSSIFDSRFHDAMVSTCFDLLRSYPDISYTYTQSDEITLIFPHGAKGFNGRTDKLLSLSAAYASVRFNAHLRAHGVAPEHLDIAYFDARVWNVPSQEELFNAVLWRARTDCKRNAVDKFARTHFTARELNGVNTRKKIDMMRLEGFAYEAEAPAWVQYGTSVKKEQYEHTGINLVTGKEENTLRMRPRSEDLELNAFNEKMVQIMVQKYW